ncbi:hypothetical protein L1887_16809 [Cichorium endivia]|nr:hypothetical protein L1887_16809 [Cichorium endivia]
MPPRKTPTRRKKSSSAITPTPVDNHKSPTPEVETGAELADVVKVDTEETLGQVELQNPNPAKIDGDSATSVAFSPESMIKAEVVLENSAVGDVNEAKNEEGEPDVCADKVTEDLPLVNEDAGKGKEGVGVGTNEDGIVCLENDKIDETIVKEKEDLQHGSENVDQDKQGSGIDGSQFETVAVVKGDNEEEKQENAEVISAQESNDNQAPCINDAALVIKDDSKDNEEGDDGSEGDDADNEDNDDPVPDNKKDKDIEIYVGRLDKNTVEDDLVNVFQQFGELKSTRIVRNSTTNKSKGFAFIRFASPDQAKRALSELKDGVEVRGKHVKISKSQDNHKLYLGNINKTWKKEEVLQQLKEYGIKHIEMIHLPENPKIDVENKGFAFLVFNTHSDAVAAFQRLKKPDAVFGCDISAKVAFAQTAMNQNDEDLPQEKRVYLEGLTKDWNEEKVKEICVKYGDIVKVDICHNPRTKNKDFGYITFASNENALACVEGINNAGIGGEVKIKANIAKSLRKNKQGVRGGFKVEASSSTSNKKGKISKEASEPKLLNMNGGLISQQVRKNKKDTSKNKAKIPQQKKRIIKNGENFKKAELTNKKNDSNSQQRKRKAPSEHVLNAPPNLKHGDHGTPKKPKFGGEGQSSKSATKPGNHKRKGREDGGNRNNPNKKPFKQPKGNMHGRERDNFRNQNSIRRGHDEYRNSIRYMDPYAPTLTYSMAPDSLSTRRFKEMEPHAGYIEPSSATHTRSYSNYVQPVLRTHSQHQTVYLSPAAGSQSQSQSQSQLYSRYSDRSIMTQSHRGYVESAVVPEVQPYRGYQQSSILQIPGDPYESYDYGLPRTVRHDGRGTAATYVGGPPLPASQVRNHTSYYQGGGSYGGGYSSQRTYY